MNLSMPANVADAYRSGSQRARVVTEFWAESNLFCPNCSSPALSRLRNNTKASDFACPQCDFRYQLKGQKTRIGNSITDGAYEAMMAAIRNDATPNFYFLHYDLATWNIKNLLLVPSFAFPPSAIIKRPPLAATARRAGWIGCTFDLRRVPPDARIAIISTPEVGRDVPIAPPPDKKPRLAGDSEPYLAPPSSILHSPSSPQPSTIILPPAEVRARFRRVKPLREISANQRGWTLDVLNIVRRLAATFTNSDVYAFERELEQLHPGNRHIRDKIRQQLQVLRDMGLLEHVGTSEWRLK